MHTETYLILVAIHFIADFLLQHSKMSLNKSKSIYWLSIHVLVYSVTLLIGTFLFIDFRDFGALVSFVLINMVLHWVTDFFTSKLTTILYKRHSEKPGETFLFDTWMHWFFVVIGFDQVVHYSCLFMTYKYLILK